MYVLLLICCFQIRKIMLRKYSGMTFVLSVRSERGRGPLAVSPALARLSSVAATVVSSPSPSLHDYSRKVGIVNFLSILYRM